MRHVSNFSVMKGALAVKSNTALNALLVRTGRVGTERMPKKSCIYCIYKKIADELMCNDEKDLVGGVNTMPNFLFLSITGDICFGFEYIGAKKKN